MDTTQQWQTVDRIQKTVENYFASECVQQVVIYDVRHTNNDMIVDITVGTVLKKMDQIELRRAWQIRLWSEKLNFLTCQARF